MNRRRMLTPAIMAVLGLAVAVPAGALAQEKQRVTYKVAPENSKYTQQHVIDVGDVPGHQVRVYELHRTFPANAPVINGLRLTETWGRAVTDYIDGNGSSTTYTVYVLENGDKFFSRAALVAQSDGSGKLTATSVGPITGGTGKFAGIQGMVSGLATATPKTGINEGQTAIEYWFVK